MPITLFKLYEIDMAPVTVNLKYTGKCFASKEMAYALGKTLAQEWCESSGELQTYSSGGGNRLFIGDSDFGILVKETEINEK